MSTRRVTRFSGSWKVAGSPVGSRLGCASASESVGPTVKHSVSGSSVQPSGAAVSVTHQRPPSRPATPISPIVPSVSLSPLSVTSKPESFGMLPKRRRTEAALPVRGDVVGPRLGAHHVEGRAGARRVGALVALGPGTGAVRVVEGGRAGQSLRDGDGPGGRRAGREQRSARRRELLDGVAAGLGVGDGDGPVGPGGDDGGTRAGRGVGRHQERRAGTRCADPARRRSSR